MKILNEKPLITPICLKPGDTLNVFWEEYKIPKRGDLLTEYPKELVRMTTKIETEQVVDYLKLVEYTLEEAEALGFNSALGIIAGEKQ